MARKLYTLNPSRAEPLKSTQYLKLVSNCHTIATEQLGTSFYFTGNFNSGVSSITLITASGSGTIKAGDTFIIPEADPATVYTVEEDVEVTTSVEFTLAFSPAMTSPQVENWSISLTTVVVRGEAVDRSVVMTYESNRD